MVVRGGKGGLNVTGRTITSGCTLARGKRGIQAVAVILPDQAGTKSRTHDDAGGGHGD
ncbi:hypothetical protein CBM2629_A170034 [Cupriavidus taiwanensis]|nr:hypothetical protein CBM2621_A160151 [Cupriavidus taiwanensis]SPA44807.1 hypothetical protein CBM2629_A170034 [Cupriavidus taiwanensis]SPD43823.1 protein of unknown function [Cupriavidus taiwanensis]